MSGEKTRTTVRRPERSRKGRYVIVDPYLRFYFRFLAPNLGFIERGMVEQAVNLSRPAFPHLGDRAFNTLIGTLADAYRERGLSSGTPEELPTAGSSFDVWTKVGLVAGCFSPDLSPAPSWHSASPLVGLVCGLIVLASAGLNVVWGWQLRRTEGVHEQRLARWGALVSGMGMIADWVSGYYGFGSLMALLTGIWLMMKHPNG